MDVFDEGFVAFWRALHEEGVRYIMVGGFATNFHGFARVTDDIDLWIEDTLENRKRRRAAFVKDEIGDYEPLERMEFIPGWTFFYLNNGFRLDIMTEIKGLEEISFDECYKLAVIAEIKDIPIRFLHYNHLIESKKADNRPKDQLDIIELEKIRRIAEENDQ